MRNRILFGLVAAGLTGGFLSAWVYGQEPAPQAPAFTPASNPFVRGVYANGIVESLQAHGQNTNLYPEVTGVITAIPVSEGQTVKRGDVVLVLDDSVQRATVAQLAAQARGARVQLEELRAQPRKETLEVSAAQVTQAKAAMVTADSTREKQEHAYALDPRAVSKQTLDDAINAALQAKAGLLVAQRQYDLTKAGAWSYDIANQEQQAIGLEKATASAEALLAKYTLRAPRDGVVLSVWAAIGSYVSPQGVFDTYTQANDPILTMGDAGELAVRCYVDEILVPRLGDPSKLSARMFVRGTNISVPLSFVRVQPYVSPKIELSNQRTEKVDLRVLPVIFRFAQPPNTRVYPGQLVDVYLSEEKR